MNKRVVIYYVLGFVICACSLLLRFFWLESAPQVPGMLRTFIFGLPWISVAGVLAWWRSRDLPKTYPLAFVFGTVTPLIVATIWLALR